MELAVLKAKASQRLSETEARLVIQAVGCDEYTHTVIRTCCGNHSMKIGFAYYVDAKNQPYVYEWRDAEPVMERDFTGDTGATIERSVRDYAASCGVDKSKKIMDINAAVKLIVA